MTSSPVLVSLSIALSLSHPPQSIYFLHFNLRQVCGRSATCHWPSARQVNGYQVPPQNLDKETFLQLPSKNSLFFPGARLSVCISFFLSESVGKLQVFFNIILFLSQNVLFKISFYYICVSFIGFRTESYFSIKEHKKISLKQWILVVKLFTISFSHLLCCINKDVSRGFWNSVSRAHIFRRSTLSLG